MQKTMVWLVTCLVLAVAGQALAESPTSASFLRTEYYVLGGGASATWQAQTTPMVHHQIGGQGNSGQGSGGQGSGSTPDEFGTAAPAADNEDSAASGSGNKVKAGLLSAVLPGAGQYYNGQKQKAYIMGGIEVAIWTAYFVFDAQGDNKREDAEEWAAIYAGTSGNHADRYWRDVGHFANSDDYDESVLREARALAEEPSGLIGNGPDAWQWVNVDRQTGYSKLRPRR